MAVKRNNFKRKRLFKTVVKLLILLYFIFISIKISSTIVNNFKKEDELKILNSKLENYTYENEKLRKQIDSGLTTDFVSEQARSKLNMISPSERVFCNIEIDEKSNH